MFELLLVSKQFALNHFVNDVFDGKVIFTSSFQNRFDLFTICELNLGSRRIDDQSRNKVVSDLFLLRHQVFLEFVDVSKLLSIRSHAAGIDFGATFRFVLNDKPEKNIASAVGSITSAEPVDRIEALQRKAGRINFSMTLIARLDIAMRF